MDTLKTAVVVVLLLAVLYGVYVFLNQNEQMPVDLAWPDPQAESESGVNLQVPDTAAFESGVSTIGAASQPMSSGEPSWSNATSADSLPAAVPLPEMDLSATPSSSPPPASAASAITPPALLGADNPLSSEVATSDSAALPTPSDYTNETAAVGEMSSYGETTTNVTDMLPADDRVGELASETTMASALAATTAETAPRYADTVAPVVSPQEGAPVGENANALEPSPLQSVVQSVQAKIDAGEWYEALLKLSFYYSRESLNEAERQQLLDLLDPLAGKVVYSNEHLIEAAYQAQGNETLHDIAQRHDVPWQLLANINGIQNPQALTPGTQLKVVRGPFRVNISLSLNELTLYAGKLYAGRFKIVVGNNPAPQPGEYRIGDKLPGRTFYAGNGQTIAVGDPSNPYGGIWLDLGQNAGIHGSGSRGPTTEGCISLSPTDANDLYGILSTGSSVVIRP